MRSRLPEAAVALALAATLVAGAASAASASPLDETVIRVPVRSIGGGTVPPARIEVTIYKPVGAGPFPIAVLSHGSPRLASERRRAGRVRFEAQSRAFLEMGFAVVVPTRRGYGDSEGKWAEGFGSCDAPDYYQAGLESARDIVAALEAARELPGLDGGNVVLVGQSAGGFGSIAASTLQVPGVVAIVNFAGGRGSFGPHEVCGEDRLVDAMRRYGARSQVPQLWIYSTNDEYFGPGLAHRMHAAFVAAGGRAEFIESPSVGRDGHAYFSYVADWAPRVKPFIERARSAEVAPEWRAGNALPVH